MSEIAGSAASVAREHIGSTVKRRRFFVIMAVVLLLPVGIGFAPTFFLRLLFGTTDYLGGPTAVPVTLGPDLEITTFPGGPFPLHLFFHGLALTAWYVLFLAQAWLVSRQRVALHRRLGVIGVIVAGIVVATSAVTLARAAERFTTIGLPAEALTGIFVGDTGALAAFVLLVACGAYWRRNTAFHKRCMFLGALVIVGPALSSIRPAGLALDMVLPQAVRGVGFGFPLLVLACLAALIARDLKIHERIHRATIGCILLMVFGVVVGVAAVQLAGGTAAYVEALRSL